MESRCYIYVLIYRRMSQVRLLQLHRRFASTSFTGMIWMFYDNFLCNVINILRQEIVIFDFKKQILIIVIAVVSQQQLLYITYSKQMLAPRRVISQCGYIKSNQLPDNQLMFVLSVSDFRTIVSHTKKLSIKLTTITKSLE